MKYTEQVTTSPEMSQSKAIKHLPKTAIPLQMNLIRESFDVDPTSKTWLRWKIRPRHHFRNQRGWNIFNAMYGGKEAGSTVNVGYEKTYYRVRVGAHECTCHRIIFALKTGSDPGCSQIDHVDGDSLNNNPANLRLATPTENGRNRGKNKNNTSGCKGVTRIKNREKWEAKIQIGGRTLHLGYFEEITDAAAAYDRAAREHHGEFYCPF
jgi:hypothetical protein